MKLKEPEEPQAITLTNAVTDPRAMMVMLRDICVTGLAVLSAEWLLDVTQSAVLVFDEKYNVFFFGLDLLNLNLVYHINSCSKLA